jgi:hypothetical protein
MKEHMKKRLKKDTNSIHTVMRCWLSNKNKVKSLKSRQQWRDFFYVYDLFTSSLLSQTKVTLVVRELPLVALFLASY